MFTFLLTFQILLVVVLGGIGSITGSVIASLGVTILMEALRFLDGPLDLLVFGPRRARAAHGGVLGPAHGGRAVPAARAYGEPRVLVGDAVAGGLLPQARPRAGRPEGRMALLSTERVTMRFGGLTAVCGPGVGSRRTRSSASSGRTAPGRPPRST